MPFCTECGAENPRENKFCSECGKPLLVIEAPEPPADAVFPEVSSASAEPDPAPAPTYTQPQPQQQAAAKPPASSQPASFSEYESQAAAAGPVAPVPTGGLIAWSVVSVLLCLIPGIVALVQAIGINKCTTVEEQQRKMSSAKMWCIISTVLGVLFIIGKLVANR